MPDGTVSYTRDGGFQVNGDGIVVTKEGFQVNPGLTIPQNAIDITINNSGEVWVKLDGQIQPQNVGQLNTAKFINPAGLEAIGKNLFLETPASGTPIEGIPGIDGFGGLLQGTLECRTSTSSTKLPR
jgi:flagellar basal-body rod protein FlgG